MAILCQSEVSGGKLDWTLYLQSNWTPPAELEFACKFDLNSVAGTKSESELGIGLDAEIDFTLRYAFDFRFEFVFEFETVWVVKVRQGRIWIFKFWRPKTAHAIRPCIAKLSDCTTFA